jgi:hypothetical protein
MRRLARLTVLPGLLATILLGGTGAVAAHTSQQPYCGIWWGSLQKNARVSTYTTATINNLRAGRHQCFDRLVVDLGPSRSRGEQRTGYQASYASPRSMATGGPAISGGARLSVLVNAAAHDANYRPTYAPRDPLHAVNVSGFRTFRQVAFLGTFEGQTEIVLGVRARLPFRVFVLSGPGAGSRVVIDVAHRW